MMQILVNFVNQVLSYPQEFVLYVKHIFLAVFYATQILNAYNAKVGTIWTPFLIYVKLAHNKGVKFAKKVTRTNVFPAIPNFILMPLNRIVYYVGIPLMAAWSVWTRHSVQDVMWAFL